MFNRKFYPVAEVLERLFHKPKMLSRMPWWASFPIHEHVKTAEGIWWMAVMEKGEMSESDTRAQVSAIDNFCETSKTMGIYFSLFPMRRSLVGMTTLILAVASAGTVSAATLRLPSTGNVRLNSSSSTTSSATSTVSSSSKSSGVASSATSSSTSSKPKNTQVMEYCAAIAATLAKGEKTTSKDATTQKQIDQTIDLLQKANAVCGAMDVGGGSTSNSSSSSVCAADGYMGVKGTCNGKSWSTGGVCMTKEYWETQVKQSCTTGMNNVSYVQSCVTKNNVCAVSSSSSTSPVSSSCASEGFKGAKILCSGKPVSSGGVCKPKSYWETWAKQTCSGYTGFDVQAPCTLTCTK